MAFLMRSYVHKRSRYIYSVLMLFVLTGGCGAGMRAGVGSRVGAGHPDTLPSPGLFSMYFHATLSFLGQLLDEVAILWMLSSCYSIWMPRCYFPSFLRGSR